MGAEGIEIQEAPTGSGPLDPNNDADMPESVNMEVTTTIVDAPVHTISCVNCLFLLLCFSIVPFVASHVQV